MKKGQKLWSREELILAINLYCKLPFGKMHKLNPDIIEFSKLIGRSSGAVAWKLGNFASFDPSLQERGIRGAKNASKLDKEIWEQFYGNWESLAYESERLLAHWENTDLKEKYKINIEQTPTGKEKYDIVKRRVNQAFFRSMILASYDNKCCITGISHSELLVAGHIKKWSEDKENRLNPRNGIAINAFHDKAFESGLITITPEYKIKVSPKILESKRTQAIEDYLVKYDNEPIQLPTRFLPDKRFLVYHNTTRFNQ